MLNLLKSLTAMAVVFALVLMFNACNQTTEPKKGKTELSKSPDFRGVWVVTDSTGNQFDITLNPDGTATSTWKVRDNGKWKIVDEKTAHIQWDNGWNEFIIVDERGNFMRKAFAPNKPTDSKPDETGPTRKK